ncbi:unnamed protein product [Amoebophrya sp. A25]|nr:unnamed protein product [Amoebophrya sp. A25]|eukprot:GSA25T00014734001.1
MLLLVWSQAGLDFDPVPLVYCINIEEHLFKCWR